MSSDLGLERRARAIVVARAVYKAVVSFWVLAVVIMVGIWWLTTPGGYFWPVWPTFGLSTAAVVWGLAIYGRFPFRISAEQVEREMERLRRAP